MKMRCPGRAAPSPGRRLHNPLYQALCLALTTVIFQGSLHAQETQDEDKTKTLDHVTVNAAHSAVVSQGALGNLSNLETPFSTVEADAGKIADLQPASVFELFADDASISRQSGGDFTAWASYLTIRGIPVDSTSGSTKLNGLPIMLFGVSLPMEMMQAVRILKGASGFEYGFAAPGGIVDYVTKKPTDDFLLSADLGYHSDNIWQEHVDFSDRTKGDHHFGYRVNVSHEDGNSVMGTGVRRNAALVSLDADITPNLHWNLDSIYQKARFDKPVPMAFLSSYTSNVLPSISNSYDNPQADNAYDDTKFWEVNTGLYWQISDNWSLRTDVAKSNTHTVFSMDYLALINNAGYFKDETYDGWYNYSYRLARSMLNGTFSWGPVTNNVVIGANYQSADTELGYSNLTQGYVVHGYRYLSGNSKLIYSPTYGEDQNGYPSSGNQQRALFVSDTVDFGEHWSVLAGLRYTDYSQYSDTYKFSGTNVTSATRTNYSTDSRSPTAALIYKPTKNTTIYTSYVEALEAGSVVGATYANYGEQLSPITSKQHEIGFKLEKGRVNASVALFRLDRGSGYANSSNVYVQDGVSRYQGLDASGDIRISPSLRLSASWIYLDKSNYLETGNEWLIGRRVAGSYRQSGTFGVEYSPQWLPGGSVNFFARSTGETTAYQNSTSELTTDAPGYTIYNLSFKFEQPYDSHSLTYRLGINNLTDKAYWIAGNGSVFIGDRRNVFANVTFDF